MFKLVHDRDYVNVGDDKKYQKLVAKVAANIKRVRKSKKLTQEDMVKFGFNYRHYQKLESGKYSFNLHTLFRIAEALKVRPSMFLD